MTSTWLGGTGNWTDPAHWSGSAVPQNTSTDSFDVVIDAGNPAASEVTLDAQDTIGSLQIDAGDALVVTPTGTLTLDGGQILNAGEIDLHGTGSFPPDSLVLNAQNTVLSGGGFVRLDGAEIVGPSLVNMDNRIAGWGTVLAGAGGQGGFTNYGLLEADVSGKTLDTQGPGVNYGTMRAVGGGILYLVSGAGPNLVNRGTVEALDGSQVYSSDALDSEGGTFTALNHSTMTLAGNYTGTEFSTDADSQISFAGYANGTLGEVTFDGQIVLQGSGLSGTVTNRGSIRGGVTAVAPTTIVNHGNVVLQYEQAQHDGDVLSFAGGGTVTLDATNADPGPLSPIQNVDNTMRGTGRLALGQNGGLVEASGGVLHIAGIPTNHTGAFAAGAGGALEIENTVTGSGAWRADGGLIHVTGNVGTTGDIEVLHGGALAVDTAMSGGDLVVDGTGSLDVQGILRIARNVDFDGPNAGRWFFGPSASLETNGAGGAALGDWSDWQSFEAAGLDLGFVGAGFTNGNFYLPELVIGSDGRLVLRDRRDNGNRAGGGREALYVDTLVFSDSLGLLDLNGIDLYYNHLVGSPDQIIDVAAPEPATAWLFGAAFAVALAARRRTA